VKTFSDYPPVCHPVSGLPLFDWRTVVVHKPETSAGRYISSRFPVPPGHADLIAALAGLGSRAER
jgi:hypothetical protein